MDPNEAVATLVKRNPKYGESLAVWRDLAAEIPPDGHARLVELLVEDNFFRWLAVISELLPSLVTREDFSDIVRSLAERCAGDLAAGPFLAALHLTGMRSPEAAKTHIVRLQAVDTPPTRLAAGIMATGVAAQDEGWARALVEDLLNAGRAPAALRVMESLLIEGIAARDILERLLSFYPSGREECGLYASCLRVSRGLAPARVDERFVSLAQQTTEDERAVVLMEAVATLRRNALGLPARKTLARLALDEGQRASYSAVELLVSVYREDAPFVCDELTRLAREHFLSTWLGMSAESRLYSDLSDIAREPMRRALVAWIGGEAKLPYQAPDALFQLHEGQELELLDTIREWGGGEPKKFAVRLKLLQDIVSQRKDNTTHERAVADAIELGRTGGAETPAVLEGESDPKWRALRMLQHMQFPVKDVDYEALARNLDLVPHVRDFMGTTWWASLAKVSAKDNLLPHMFHRAPPIEAEIESAKRECIEAEGDARIGRALRLNHLVGRVRAFEYWDAVFSALDPSLPGLGNLRRKLKNPTEVADALCEAEITSALLRNLPTAVEPEVPGLKSRPDLLVRVGGQEIVLEVYNPKPPRELQFASGTHGLSLTRIRGLVLDKYRRQFKHGASEFHLPVVIVMNANGTTLDDYEFEAIFQGSPRVTFTMDTTGQTVDARPTRADDHIGTEDADTAVISGALGYRRNLTDYDAPTLTLDYYPNPNARNPLSPEMVDEICAALGVRPLRP